MSDLKVIESVEERNELIENNKLLVIDYYAKWCGPCKRIHPDLVKIQEELGKENEILIVKENIDDNLELDALPSIIKCLPTFHFYVNGEFDPNLTIEGANVSDVKLAINKIRLG